MASESPPADSQQPEKRQRVDSDDDRENKDLATDLKNGKSMLSDSEEEEDSPTSGGGEEVQKVSIYTPTICVDSDEEVVWEDGTRDLTRAEYRIYRQQIVDSEGFDVGYFPGTNVCGQIFPLFLDEMSEADLKVLQDLSNEAIQDYCTKYTANYEFDKVIKANVKGACGLLYYITFQARDANANSDRTDIFQAKVLCGVEDNEVQLCRLKAVK